MKRLSTIFRGITVLILTIGLMGSAGVLVNAQADEIRIADSKGDWGYPNPYRHYPRGPGYVRMSWVFDTLIWKDENGYIPALARSWTYNPDTLSFTFELQEGVKWHDGKPFSAADVVFTIEYFKKHPYRWVPIGDVSGAEAFGPKKVVIRLKKPYAPFLAYVGGVMPILPKHIWQNVTDPKKFNDPGSFIGCGPYKFIDFNKAKGTYLYEAFKDYYQGRPKADRLIYIKAGKPLMTLSTGKADMANIKPDMADALKKNGMVILINARGWNKKLMINHTKAPFNDKRFRQALAHAINQQEIIDKAHRGFGCPASFGLLSPDHEFYNPDTPTYAPDQAKARRILESLGYKKDGRGYYSKDGRPLKIRLLSSNITVAGESMADRDGEVIKHQLEAAGIHIDLVNMEQATTDAKVKKWDFDLAISGHGGLLGDARILNRMINPKATGSVNSARFGANKKLLKLLKDQVAEMDVVRRKALVYKIQEIYADEVPAISLYYPASMAAYSPKKGIKWYYTKGGIGLGIPIAQNKMSLIK
ncbi:MAG: peptide/nickel transport system substrate-binding protein [Desulfobacteraceae bacterium Eth-SRB1]|nr:MAG: peptide/nickel transport system substrate-binding protein [Desulfobacteraceae bacterium Eth-SRB1]